MSEKKRVLNPSQYQNTFVYVLCGLIVAVFVWLWGGGEDKEFLIPAIIPLLISFIKFLNTKFISYEITEEMLKVKEGILNQTVNDCWLFRVKDISVEKPIFLRIFGLGNLILDTSDHSTPIIKLIALYDVDDLKDVLQELVEVQRKKHGVREID